MVFSLKLSNMKRRIFAILEWMFISVLTGTLCGVVGALFSKTVAYATSFRHVNGWIILLLPVGGLLSVLIYRTLRVTNHGTDDAVRSAHTNDKVSFLLTPATFVCSAITHLFGGSAGREGASLKMGAGIAAFMTGIFRLDERNRRTLSLAGMSGVFAAVFGAPVGAAVFTLEVVRTRTVHRWGLITSLISSGCAYYTAIYLGGGAERFDAGVMPDMSFNVLWRVVVLSALCGVVSYIFCCAMKQSSRTAKHLFKNEYVRISVCALVIVLLTIAVGTQDYNGGGMEVVERIFEGQGVRMEAFLFKIAFTALTVAAGFKGGEIVPAFFVGAMFGAAASVFLGLSAPFCAAIGMTALFCGVTNCPVATVFIASDMFGSQGVLFFVIASAVSFLFSGEPCLYDGKKYPFEQLKNETV